MVPIHSIPVDTSRVLSYFSYLPVRIHKEVAAIDAATMDAIERCTALGSKEYKQSLYRHSNPFGNPYALCHGECNIGKLKYFVKIIELIWIDDDITEELAHVDALEDHEVLRQGLRHEYDLNMNTAKKVFLQEVKDRMLTLDPVNTPALLMTLDHYLKEYDSSEEDFQTLEEYLPYEIPLAGYRVCAHLTKWAMDIHIDDTELEAVLEFEWTLGGVLAFTNDYFS
ncbi:hypothetical protein BDQ17DRAFT_1261850 [Cyathus striatus]|nr:hypothetical protein BDQ17DRAFT_1261850 [Cyathus striatus]